MRAKEITVLSEVAQAKLTKRQQRSTVGAHLYSDAEHANSDYTMFRLGMALAMTDGKTKPDIDPKSWIGKHKFNNPYTEEEVNMLKLAYKAVGATWHDLNDGDLDSHELNSINNVSPVAKPKKNRYGV